MKREELVGFWCWDADHGSPRQAQSVRPYENSQPKYGERSEQAAARVFAAGLWRTRTEREITVRVSVAYFNGCDMKTWVFTVRVSSEPAASVLEGSSAQMANVEALITGESKP